MASLERGIYADIDSLFSRNPTTGDVSRVLDESAIKQAITNLIFTGKYERLFQPNLFCGIQNDLFEHVTPIAAESIRAKIISVISTHEPRVEDLKVSVLAAAQKNGYEVTISYLPRKNIEPVSVSFFLQRVI